MRVKHENLRVWSEAMDLAEQIYSVSRAFPRREDFALTAQIRRSAASVPTNIAEGCGRFHTKDFIHFLYIARGSLFEFMTLLDLAMRIGYLSGVQQGESRRKSEEILVALSGLIRSLERRMRV